MKRTVLIAVAVCAVFFISATSSFGQVINGCVKQNNGDLRIVSSPGQCRNNEAPISWNATGPAGVANGIRAAVWGEFIMDSENAGQHCSVPFFRGADNVVGVTTGNDAECRLTFTLPAGQPQSWGTAYACFTSIVSGNGTSYDTTCQNTGDMDASLKPAPIFACRNGSNSVPSPFFAYIDFFCITQ